MRFNVQIELLNEEIPKDKNRMILSLLKHIYESYDPSYYKSLYEEEKNKMKDFTFSLYMARCIFKRETILVPDKKIILNFSTSNMIDGITFYNAILAYKDKAYKIKDNMLTIRGISMNNEKLITTDYAIYKTMGPIVVREHSGDNKKTWYYSLNEEKGLEVFLGNLKYQLIRHFGEDRKLDIEELKIEIIRNKEVKVKNYGIEVLSNICRLKIYAKPYILDYIYKTGLGSKRAGGFGMLDLV